MILCLNLSEITELAFAQANGELPPSSLADQLDHALHCPKCSQQMAQQVDVIHRLKSAVRKTPAPDSAFCLDDNTLSEFLENKLDIQDRQQAEVHLAKCNNCLHQLLDLFDMSSETEHSEAKDETQGVFEVVIGILADGLLRLVEAPSDGFTLDNAAPLPVLGPLVQSGEEGSTSAVGWTQLANGLKVKVSIVGGSQDSVHALIQLDPPTSALITVRRAGQIVFSEAFNGPNSVRVSNLRFGTYECSVKTSPRAVARFWLRIVGMSLS